MLEKYWCTEFAMSRAKLIKKNVVGMFFKRSYHQCLHGMNLSKSSYDIKVYFANCMQCKNFFLNLQKGKSYELMFVHASIISFYRNQFISFSWNLLTDKNFDAKRVASRNSKKNLVCPKMSKNGPKWPKSRVFGFLKILSLHFAGSSRYSCFVLLTWFFKIFLLG